jgi:hypothetical protein
MIAGPVTPELVLYEVALILLAGSCLLYAVILKQLLALIQRRVLWLLPVISAALIAVSAYLHGFAAVVLTPLIGADPSIYKQSMLLRTLSIGGLLGAGLFAAVAGLLYYRRMGDVRS